MHGPLAVSVIVPTIDGKDLLADCLRSLHAQTLPAHRFEIIVVDNGSSDGTSEWLRTTHPDVVVVREETNLGFAEGSNRGAAAAHGELLVFLNNDTFATPRFLEELMRVAAASSETVACVAGRILDWDGKQIEFGGAGLSVFGLGFQRSSWQPAFAESREGDALPFACGGAMLVRANVFAAIGGFDPDYFAYYEDVDLGWRLWLAGHRVIYAPGAEVRHHRYATTKRIVGRQQHFYWYRNALQTLVKNSDDSWLRQVLPYAFAVCLRRIGALYDAAAVAHSNAEEAEAEFLMGSAVGAADGVTWVLEHLEELREKRAQVQRQRRVPDRDLAEIFGVSLDLGPDSHTTENAFALRLLPLMDLSGLMSADRVAAGAIEAAARLAQAAAEAPQLRTEVVRLGRDLDARNRDAAGLHQELHARNLAVESLHRDLHERNLEIQRLQNDVSTRTAELEALRREFDAVLSSKSWRWTAPVRSLLRQR